MHRVSTTISVNMIEEKRRGKLRKLAKRRAKHLKYLDKIDARIALISENGTLARGPGRRRRNKTSLADALHHAPSKSSRPMGIREIAEKVEAGGYTSGRANFPALVNLTLIKNRRFLREARGVYGLRAANLAARAPATAGEETRRAIGRKAAAKRKRPGAGTEPAKGGKV